MKNKVFMIIAIILAVACVVFFILAVMPHANGSIDKLKDNWQECMERNVDARAELEDYKEELQDMDYYVYKDGEIVYNEKRTRQERLIELQEIQLEIYEKQELNAWSRQKDLSEESTMYGLFSGISAVLSITMFVLSRKKKEEE